MRIEKEDDHETANENELMEKRSDGLDEYQMASYLSGDLPAGDRASISAHLAVNASDRELLSMAGEAMDAATGGDGRSATIRRRKGAKDRPPFQTQSQRWLVRTVMILTLVNIVMGASLLLHVLVGERVGDAVLIPNMTVDWTPVLRSDDFSVSWSAVEGADAYVVVIMDPNSERLVRRIETSATSLSDIFRRPDNESGLPDHVVPRSGEILDLWISAFDARGRLLRRSSRIPFTAES